MYIHIHVLTYIYIYIYMCVYTLFDDLPGCVFLILRKCDTPDYYYNAFAKIVDKTPGFLDSGAEWAMAVGERW